MNFMAHINTYIFPMILLAIIAFSVQKKSIRTMENYLFQQLTTVTFLLLFVDLCSWFLDGRNLTHITAHLRVFNMIYFVLTPLVSILWLNYLSFYLHQKTILTFTPLKRFFTFLPLGVYYVMLILTPITKWIFSINTNHYERGSFYVFPYLLNLYYVLLSCAICIWAIRKETFQSRKNKCIYFIFLTSLPVLASALQLFLNAVYISLPVMALTELLLYIDTQNEQITVDALTGLNNRGCFDDYLKNAVMQPKAGYHLYLFMMDLNHFKVINDNYGHTAGDQALVYAARILRLCLRNTSGFLSRYGGDEFAIVLYCKDDNEAKDFSAKIKQEFFNAKNELNVPYSLSISVGYASLDKDWGTPIKTLIKLADAMMYQDKKGGLRHES